MSTAFSLSGLSVRRTTALSRTSLTSAAAREVRSVSYLPLVDRQADWLTDVSQEILHIYSTAWPDVVTREALVKLITLVANPSFAGAIRPFVSYIEGGGLALEFRGHHAELQLEVDADGTATAYALERLADGVTEWDGLVEDLPRGIDWWAWQLGEAD